MNNRAVIFAPHFDDELLVGGGLLFSLIKSEEWETFVVFMTNGDYYPYEAEIRMREALIANSVLGLDKEHVIFLGYGDRWIGEKHLYNSSNGMKSYANKSLTYSITEKNEFCFENKRIHREC